MVYFLIALTLTAILLFFCLKKSINFGLIAPPNTDVATHTKPIPLIGGLLILFVSLIVASVVLKTSGYSTNYLLGITPLLLLGLIKDKIQRPVSPFLQFLIQGLSSYFIYMQWLEVNSLEFSWFWLVVVMGLSNVLINAFNFLDVSDGLAGSYSAIVFLTLSLGALNAGNLDMFYLALIFLGSNMAFLIFNWHPARVFLGDVGSFCLMYTLLFISVTIFGFEKNSYLLGLSFVFFVPLFEFLFTTTRRILLGKLPYNGDANHASLTLLNSGWRSSMIAFLALLSSAITCGIGLYFLS